MTSPKEVKEKYDDLNIVIKAVPRCDKLILPGDFKARVGTDYKTWSSVIGKNGVGKCNGNGLLLLQSCAEHGLMITNTLFCLCTHNKTSWMHPQSKHWHLIDYVIKRRRDLQDVRALCGAECWTGHRLIITKLKVHIQPPCQPQGKRVPKRLNISKMQSLPVRQLLYEDLKQKLPKLKTSKTDVESSWTALKELLYSTTLHHLSLNMHRQQDWFNESNTEIQKILDDKYWAH